LIRSRGRSCRRRAPTSPPSSPPRRRRRRRPTRLPPPLPLLRLQAAPPPHAAKAEAEAKKADAAKADAAVAEEKKEFVLPPVPPPRVTYAETLSKPHETDGSAALVLASVDYFVGLLREVAGAGVRPALHLRVTIGIIVVSIVCGFLSEIAPSCVTAFLMLEAIDGGAVHCRAFDQGDERCAKEELVKPQLNI
jgi:hypothetical protein